MPSLLPASRQHIPVITPGIGFLRHPAPQRLVVGCQLLREPLRVAPFRASICHDCRRVLYAGSRSDGYCVTSEYTACGLSLLGLPVSRLVVLAGCAHLHLRAGASVTTLQIHLRFRSPSSPARRVAESALCLSPLPPCTPAVDNQSHAVGRFAAVSHSSGRLELTTRLDSRIISPTWTLSCQGSCQQDGYC